MNLKRGNRPDDLLVSFMDERVYRKQMIVQFHIPPTNTIGRLNQIHQSLVDDFIQTWFCFDILCQIKMDQRMMFQRCCQKLQITILFGLSKMFSVDQIKVKQYDGIIVSLINVGNIGFGDIYFHNGHEYMMKIIDNIKISTNLCFFQIKKI